MPQPKPQHTSRTEPDHSSASWRVLSQADCQECDDSDSRSERSVIPTGLGIGFSLCLLLGGTIWITSGIAAGRGTEGLGQNPGVAPLPVPQVRYPSEPFTPPSVWIEDLTWTEVATLQAQGFDSVLIPTGGTEQNGPHLTIGKHNKIVKYTAEAIAREYGGTLVAPVLSYVPEAPHALFPGTVDIGESLFEPVVEAAASAFLQQGFDTVLLIGDSGGNQAGLQRAADRVLAKFPQGSKRVLYLGDYYNDDEQREFLRAEGFTDLQIGSHAGLMDTSELMAIDPTSVRLPDKVMRLNGPPGHDGDWQSATEGIGNKLLEIKVQSAIRQLRRVAPRGKPSSG